ncbi:MAG: DoxX family protein [Bacteroidales bacterium]|jgi:uncharacterized membrane protein YphA (DoxX/SURF4 family)|nr:DoxX family protein [Bacteroidales bacterium]
MIFQNKIISLILRIFVGLVFIASAILKYISIDIFDLYVYEHNLFSIPTTETLSRLLITAELVLGIMLVVGIQVKTAYYACLCFLGGFTLYLFLLPYLFDVDIQNCHCFGEAIVFNRTQSIIKNIILMVCLLFVSPAFYPPRKWEMRVLIPVAAVSFIVFMTINAPNYLYTIVHKDKIRIDVPIYEAALQNSGHEEEFTQGKQIICMYSPWCTYCRRTALKMNLILKNNHLSDDNVKAIFFAGIPDSSITKFFTLQDIKPLEYITFRADSFLMITEEKIPVILFSDEGNIVKKADYLSLKDKDVVDFLSER